MSEKTDRQRYDEVSWTDRDGVYTRVIGFKETHLEQPTAPEDAVALVATGAHRSEKTNSMGRDRERKWIELNDGAYLTADQAVETALLLLDAAAQWRAENVEFEGPVGPVADDDARRWELHVHACSIRDHTFWVRRTENGWQATEVETGCSAAEAPTAREALDNYWERRWPESYQPPVIDESDAR